MVSAGLGGFEPGCGIAAGQHVCLDSKYRNKEAVNHVLRDECDLYRTPCRNVEGVDLALSSGVLELPHPLLAHSINLQSIGGRALYMEVQGRAPDKDHHGDAERDHCPHNLQQGRSMNLFSLAS